MHSPSEPDRALSRRGLIAALATTGAVVAAEARAEAPRARAGKGMNRPAAPNPAADGGPTGVVQEVGPGAFAYIQTQPAGTSNLNVSNAGWVEGPDHVLLIDSLAAPLHAQALRGAIAARTDKPIRRIVLTHHHGDHTGGLPFFMPADVIANQGCYDLMKLAAPGKPPAWTARPGWATGAEEWKMILPAITFDHHMALRDYGPGRIEVFNPGLAHTAGDTVVRLRDARAAYIGDIGFFKTTPLARQAYITDIIALYHNMMAWEVDTFVPGHGPVGGKAELKDNLDYFVLLHDAARKGYDAGWSAGRTAAEMDLGKFKGWTDEDRVAVNTWRAYEEFSGHEGVVADPDKGAATLAEYKKLKGLT